MLHNAARVLACYLNASAETTHHHKNEVGVNKKIQFLNSIRLYVLAKIGFVNL